MIKNDYKDIALDYLERFDLIDKKDELTTELSKGMKQKLSIICNLVIDPKIYFFDEPMIGLDPKAIKTLKNLLVELKNKGKAIFVSTHLLDSIEHICDQILVMKNGSIITRGSLEELKGTQKITLEELFLQVTKDE
jgi:ABC-type multidrug transport system ATPase subunit